MAHKEDRQARVPLHGLIHQGVQVLDHALPAVFIGKMPLYLGGTAMAGMVVHIDRKAVFSQKSGEMVIPAAVLGHSVGDDYDCPGLGVTQLREKICPQPLEAGWNPSFTSIIDPP